MRKYDYTYEGSDFYCYPDSQVLINKFGIKDYEKLAEIEQTITFAKDVDFDNNPIKGKFDLDHICKIHEYLFGDIFDWAGEVRGGDYMFKGDTMFHRAIYLEQGYSDYYEKLKAENFLIGLDKDTFCERLAFFMGELNALHPFREGNGRTSRLYFKQLAKNAGYKLKFSNVTAEELLNADISAFNREYEPLIEVLKKVVS